MINVCSDKMENLEKTLRKTLDAGQEHQISNDQLQEILELEEYFMDVSLYRELMDLRDYRFEEEQYDA